MKENKITNKKDTENLIQNKIEQAFEVDWTKLLTQEHLDIIHKGISKALKQIDYSTIMTKLLTREFESIHDECLMDNAIISLLSEALRTHFINCKVIKPKSN